MHLLKCLFFTSFNNCTNNKSENPEFMYLKNHFFSLFLNYYSQVDDAMGCHIILFSYNSKKN